MKHQHRFQRQFDKLERVLPQRIGAWLAWLRRPQARLIRIPLGILFIVGGLLSFLPVLGIWMLPLGILLLAIDLPVLQGPTGMAFVRGQRWWQQRKRRKRDRTTTPGSTAADPAKTHPLAARPSPRLEPTKSPEN